MSQTASPEITQLLLAWGEGDKQALDKLMPFVYQELRRLAKNYMLNQPSDHTLQTTALVNEAYLRLVDSSRVRWQNRTHFFAISAQLMRRILVDFARARKTGKRGGENQRITFDDALPVSAEKEAGLIELDEALKQLETLDRRQSQIVEMRYFGGMTEEEISKALDISARTVRRDWVAARAWLYRELSKTNKENDPRKMAKSK
ncbi:MAG: sigma-70 family RNA polymerase sigma factor [Pyrinomonadaceae bacterium]